ncbi:MAG: FtsX-like permease family protein, partial [Bdellovibrionia bacterium]
TSFYGGVAALDAEIAGHVTTGLTLKDETALLMPFESAQQFFQTDMATSLSVYLKDGGQTRSFIARLRSKLEGRGFDVYRYDNADVSQFYVGAMNFVYVMVGFFIVLVCGVVILSIVNALNISLLERKTEIATLRAIGYRPLTITEIFVRENLLLASASFAAGGVLAYTVKTGINAANWRFTVPGLADDLQFMLRPGLFFTSIVVVVLIAVVEAATLIGCMSYMKRKITDLLAAV